MNNRSSIRYGDATITYEVVRSARRHKTFQTQVSLDTVRVLAPADASNRELEQLVTEQAEWILKRRQVLNDRAARRRYETGETMPYLGRDFELVVDKDRFLHPWIRFEEDRFLFDAPPGIDGHKRREMIKEAFIEWYRLEAEEYLPDRVDDWLPLIADHASPRVLIRDQQSRWASCARDGTLRFNWRAVMVAPDLIEYLVVHELSHLTVRNHSARFWDLVSFFIPDAKDRRRRLREVEPLLPLW